MDKSNVIFIVIALVGIGFSLYRRYMRKDQGKGAGGSATRNMTSFPGASKEDDYEPYSKK
jgi:hypothetical protein